MQGGSQYEDWALTKECNMVETLQEFASVQVTADLLLTQLPALQPVRYTTVCAWLNKVVCQQKRRMYFQD